MRQNAEDFFRILDEFYFDGRILKFIVWHFITFGRHYSQLLAIAKISKINSCFYVLTNFKTLKLSKQFIKIYLDFIKNYFAPKLYNF